MVAVGEGGGGPLGHLAATLLPAIGLGGAEAAVEDRPVNKPLAA